MNVRIRKAEARDVPAVRELLQILAGGEVTDEVTKDRFRMVEASAIDDLYVLEDSQGVQGLLGFRLRENLEEQSRFGEISALVTRPEARRSGYGRALVEFAEQLARERGCKGTWLVSGFGREKDAHKFYEKLGYEVTGYRFVKPI